MSLSTCDKHGGIEMHYDRTAMLSTEPCPACAEIDALVDTRLAAALDALEESTKMVHWLLKKLSIFRCDEVIAMAEKVLRDEGRLK